MARVTIPPSDPRADRAVRDYYGLPATGDLPSPLVATRERAALGAVAKTLGVDPGTVERVLWAAEPVIVPATRFPKPDLSTVEGRAATADRILAARAGLPIEGAQRIPGETPKLRLDRIAARTGLPAGRSRT